MDLSIQKILREHKVKGVFHTHVSMGQTKGRYQFNRTDLEEFWKVYINQVKNMIEIKMHNPSTPSIKFIAFVKSNKHKIVKGILKWFKWNSLFSVEKYILFNCKLGSKLKNV